MPRFFFTLAASNFNIFYAMGKGNLFLGQGRGKLGDSVFYLKNGQQAFRVRRRQISNPNTPGMLVQRAVMATVLQAYSYGKAIFDHSFQGKKVGEGNQSKFMSLNLRKLRNAYFADIAKINTGEYDETDLVARFVARGSVVPVGWSYQISEGTFKSPVFTLTPGEEPRMGLPVLSAADESPRAYFQRLGLNVGDINTVCMFANGSPTADDNQYDTPVTAAEFVFVRFVVREIPAAEDTWVGKTIGSYFNVESNSYDTSVPGEIAAESFVPTADTGWTKRLLECLSGSQDVRVTYAGIIASREDQGLRSTSYMVPLWATVGLTTNYLLDYWRAEATKVQSDLILEGGGF